MNVHLALASAFITETELLAWIGQAFPGDVLEYHRGFLALDRAGLGGSVPAQESGELSRAAATALRAAESGLVHLIQRRIGRDRFSYLMVARERKPGALSALIDAGALPAIECANEGVLACAA